MLNIANNINAFQKIKFIIINMILIISIILILLTNYINTNAAISSMWSDPRVIVGLDLFPSFLAADNNILNKTNENDKLLIVFIYKYRKIEVEKMVDYFKKMKELKNKLIDTSVINYDEIDSIQKLKPAGIFIAEPFYDLSSIVKIGINNRIIIFSPYEGDVEQGILCGIFIGAKILPYINKKTMINSKINFKSFFLRISKYYEN